jgi:hypothetical protein
MHYFDETVSSDPDIFDLFDSGESRVTEKQDNLGQM